MAEPERAKGAPGRGTEAQRRQGHAPESASVRGVIVFVFALIIGLGIAHLVTAWLLWAYTDPATTAWQGAVTVEVPGAAGADLNHWRNPPADYAELQRETLGRITGYGWVDEQAGTVRIPIDEAMTLYADELGQGRSSETGGGEPGAGSEQEVDRAQQR